MEKFGQ